MVRKIGNVHEPNLHTHNSGLDVVEVFVVGLGQSGEGEDGDGEADGADDHTGFDERRVGVAVFCERAAKLLECEGDRDERSAREVRDCRRDR
jgi:hypothetical protein